MLVDDEAVITTQLEERLTSMGYEVVGSASSGEEAVDMARCFSPDLILMDIVMPGKLNGIEASEKIRAELDIPVIFLTAYANDRFVKRARDVGPFGYLVKPFREEEIRASIEIALYRKDMERRLCESEERHRSVVDTAGDAIITVDGSRNIVSWNHASEAMFGYSADESAGKPFTFIIPERRRKEVEDEINHIVSTGQSNITGKTIEYSGLRKDGSEFPVELSLATWKTKGEIFFTLIMRDITERKQAETVLEESNRRLEGTLVELRQTQQQLIQKERLVALGQMASGIAHDFNNALTPILGYIDLILMAPGTLEDKEKVKHYLELVNATAKGVVETISNLREFYRQRAESDIFAPVNLNQLAEQTIELTQLKWKDQSLTNGVTINIEKDLQEVLPVSVNKTELREALTNLILNAVDAIPESGTITIRTRSENGNAILEVSDTGVGMTEEVRQRCFEPFFSTKEERGAGLGLSIVHGIIRRHEGTIEVESEEGKGTTFIIRLPAQEEAQVEDERQEAVTTTRPLRVLFVEDRPMVRGVIVEYLLVDGHTVETATDGRDGLEKFCAGSFDVVITDRQMPDMNGDELAAAIKQIAPNQPVIMLTGFGDIMKLSGEMPEGVDYLLSKPVTLNDFRGALAKAVAG